MWPWCLAVAVTFPAVGSKGDGTRIQAPLLADRCMESSSGIAGEKPEVLLFLQTGEYCQQRREQDCFKSYVCYFVELSKYCMYFDFL